ncbi:DUF2314 domain-containing protein [Sphingobacterium sp. SRCM116780]|uniref:DUF2314 domain-containing protein n=1 Tax=Sphingobacterium sp. SRCM116780 TaxID=2907623 RepID=UPI001F2A1AE1|nr:DUF2314 domain-containing protein [Sphingobacterium sp. SRCM116780]UIR57833.1 DUF2314 domain-containing protein [Sphingobacterium sp. SRCM116780]
MNNQIIIEVNQDYIYAVYKAKNTIWYFNELIKNGFSGYNSIKYSNNNQVFVWLENVRIEGEYYVGVLAENGDPERVPLADAIDWLVIEDARLIGGYTIRYYRRTLDEDERINFDGYYGVRIDEGNDFFRPDRSSAEGAIITIENFYNNKDLNGILSCKDFRKEAENILIENNIEINEETRSKIEAVLKISFVEDLELNGFPNFDEIDRVFTLKDQKKDQHLIEEKVIYRDGSITINNLWVGFLKDDGWKVLNRVD